MINQQPTTETTKTIEEAPEQPTLPGMEEMAPQAETRPLGSVSKTADELAEEIDQLKAKVHMRDAVYDMQVRLARAGVILPKLLALKAKDRFQFDEDGDVTNADEVFEHLKLTYPAQFTPDPVYSIDASAGRTPRPTLTKEALSRMTTTEIQRLDWNEVRSALQEK